MIREAQTLPIVGGKILSLLGLLGLAANAVVIGRAAVAGDGCTRNRIRSSYDDGERRSGAKALTFGLVNGATRP